MSVIAQSSVIPELSFFNFQPDLILVTAFAVVVSDKMHTGIIYAFFGGLLIDLLSGTPGISSISYVLVVVIGGFILKNFHIRNVMLLSFLIVVLSIAQQYIYSISLVLAGEKIIFAGSLANLLIPSIFNSIVYFLIIKPIDMMFRSISKGTSEVIGRGTSIIKSKNI